MHVDGDAFFASCEQATNMQWRRKPIAVGRERGIVTAISYEAKALGVRRPMSQAELSKEFPQVALLASDYRKYELFSERMKNIVRRQIFQASPHGVTCEVLRKRCKKNFVQNLDLLFPSVLDQR